MTDFVYPDMTPELHAYLDLRKKHPGYKYEKGCGSPTDESKQAVESWRESLQQMEKSLPNGEPGRYYLEHKIWLCRDETIVGEADTEESPSGTYSLVITYHKTGENTWTYSKGRVYKDGSLLTTIYRNYSSFPFAWVESHPKGDFLVCGEHYMSQTVVDLKNGTTVSNPHHGFCWSNIHPSPDGLLLAVDGCHWGAPYEVKIFDFSDPMTLPHQVLEASGADSFGGWVSEYSCNMGSSFEVVDLPEHPLNGKKIWDCSDDELDEVCAVAKERGLVNEGCRTDREDRLWTRES